MLAALQLLYIDDNDTRRHDVKLILEFLGEDCVAVNSQHALEHMQNPQELLAILVGDIQGDHNALLRQMIEKVPQNEMQLPFLLLREKNQKELAVASDILRHCIDCVDWPSQYALLLDILHRCQIMRDNHHVVYEHHAADLYKTLVGHSTQIQQVRQLIEQVATSNASVLVLGESGTGKEVVAKHIHEQSERHNGPFVPVNCGAIPSELLESELFGHEKGAFTGAINARQGRFEMAKGGTLFLDEIGDMPLAMQVKLLRVLQERTFERVGSNKTLEADVRIVAATNTDLEQLIKEGKFREDLFYRLNVFPIELPALRQRAGDVPALINELIARLEKAGRASIRLMPDAITALCHYQWPGNIRELANLIERLVILHPHGMVTAQDLPKKFINVTTNVANNTSLSAFKLLDIPVDSQDTPSALPYDGIDLKQHLSTLELQYIKQALEDCDGVVAHAAERLKMRRTTLVEKMRKYGIDKSEHTVTG